MYRKDFVKMIMGGAAAGFLAAGSDPKTMAAVSKSPARLMRVFIAGYSYYKGEDYEKELLPGTLLSLRREPDNRYDHRAIAVYYRNEKIGFIPRSENKLPSRLMDQQVNLFARVVNVYPENHPEERIRMEVLMERGGEA